MEVQKDGKIVRVLDAKGKILHIIRCGSASRANSVENEERERVKHAKKAGSGTEYNPNTKIE